MSHTYSIPQFLRVRELDERNCRPFQKRLHVTTDFIKRLSLEKELDGHTGCVNCLEWDAQGRKLASASDDFLVIIWDPFTYRRLQTIQTGHHGNIFSVKFMPETNGETIVTGAGDHEVRVHNVVCKETTRVCTCHAGRVKRLGTAPAMNDVFWSAAEDGLIRQFDLRLPHSCLRNEQTVLIDLRTYSGDAIEAKCLAVNPIKTELLAVGANDPYIRIYDRRMIRLVKSTIASSTLCEDNVPPGCVQHFVPGHIACRRKSTESDLHEYSATYVAFGPNGNELLVNLGSEQIYLFDITTNMTSLLVRLTNDNRELKEPLKGYCNGINSSASYLSYKNKSTLPEHINSLKLGGNSFFEKECYSVAIRIYNQAIAEYPDSSVLYSNRAAAYMKREWCGDTYAALRDCITALNYDPNNVKAYFRMTRCLFDLAWYEEAKLTLNSFKQQFPSHAKLLACRALERDILAKLESSDESMDDSGELDYASDISLKESEWREKAKDYHLRFYGHCNTTTDIKEANFFGSDGDFIVAGSDDGSIFFWDRKTTNNIRILKGDSSIVNCVQPHPTCCLLATSGIEHRIRLWSPRSQHGLEDQLEILERDEVAETNQRRMQADPFDVVLMNMGLRSPDTADPIGATYGCRTS